MAEVLLQVEHVRHFFGSFQALNDLSFEVAPGEFFGLLGPNGAGKSTLISILSGLMAATSGQVRLGGQRIDPAALAGRREIGIVPQDLALYAELTARENLAFFGQLYGLQGRELTHRVDEVLTSIGLRDRAEDRAGTFSGGMKRRLNLGAALIHRPRILFLDEPTVGVDPQSRKHIFDEVRRLNAEGMTIVYTSHYMEEVQSLCTRVGILDHGRWIACDTLPRLLRTLPAIIQFSLPEFPPALLEKLHALPAQITRLDRKIEISTGQPQSILRNVLSCLTEMGIETDDLEVQEPNLERVFLHLTGHELRD